MRVAGVVLTLFGVDPTQIFVISILGQDIDRELLHHDGLFVGNHFVWSLLDIVLDWTLIIAVCLNLQAIELDLFSAQSDRLFHDVDPVLNRLTRMTKNEFNVHLVTSVLRIFDCFQGHLFIMRPVHDLEHARVEGLDSQS